MTTQALVLTEAMTIKRDRSLRWYPRHDAPNPGVAFIANHPYVKLCFSADTHRWAFARYFCALQARTMERGELLSLRDTIERYMCSSYREIAEEIADD